MDSEFVAGDKDGKLLSVRPGVLWQKLGEEILLPSVSVLAVLVEGFEKVVCSLVKACWFKP